MWGPSGMAENKNVNIMPSSAPSSVPAPAPAPQVIIDTPSPPPKGDAVESGVGFDKLEKGLESTEHKDEKQGKEADEAKMRNMERSRAVNADVMSLLTDTRLNSMLESIP